MLPQFNVSLDQFHNQRLYDMFYDLREDVADPGFYTGHTVGFGICYSPAALEAAVEFVKEHPVPPLEGLDFYLDGVHRFKDTCTCGQTLGNKTDAIAFLRLTLSNLLDHFKKPKEEYVAPSPDLLGVCSGILEYHDHASSFPGMGRFRDIYRTLEQQRRANNRLMLASLIGDMLYQLSMMCNQSPTTPHSRELIYAISNSDYKGLMQ